MREAIGRRLDDAAQLVTLPTALTRNVVRATDAIIEIRDQLRTLVDLPREVLDQLRAMQEVAERMQRTAEEIHAIAEPMLETARGIHQIADPMLTTGQAATRAAEEARDAVTRTNELIERTLDLAWPLEAVSRRARGRRERQAVAPETGQESAPGASAPEGSAATGSTGKPDPTREA
jgi:hypothetical protein